MAAIQTHGIVERGLALLGPLVAGIGQPAIALQQHGGAEVLLAVPPVARARGRAARAQDAFVQPVEFLALPRRLAVFAPVRGRGGALQVRSDGFVLFVELGQVRDEVFDDVGVGEGVDACFVFGVGGDAALLVLC